MRKGRGMGSQRHGWEVGGKELGGLISVIEAVHTVTRCGDVRRAKRDAAGDQDRR